MTSSETTYRFTLILSGGNGLTEAVQDALFNAGCDDAILGERGGVLYLDFDRKGESLAHAVLAAARDVDRAGGGLRAARVEYGDARSLP